MYWEIHPPRPERFPKGGDFAPRGPRDFPRAKPEGNLEGRGVQNPRPREISRAEGGVFPNASRLEAVYGHSLLLDREGLELTLSGCTVSSWGGCGGCGMCGGCGGFEGLKGVVGVEGVICMVCMVGVVDLMSLMSVAGLVGVVFVESLEGLVYVVGVVVCTMCLFNPFEPYNAP